MFVSLKEPIHVDIQSPTTYYTAETRACFHTGISMVLVAGAGGPGLRELHFEETEVKLRKKLSILSVLFSGVVTWDAIRRDYTAYATNV